MFNTVNVSALVGLAIAMLIPGVVEAHSGGLNSDGCHAGSKPYHCHRGSGGSKRRRDTSRSRGGDLDCKDFGSWREAQYFYEQFLPYDPHRLDRDSDGIACEHLQ